MAIPEEDYATRYVGDVSSDLCHTFVDGAKKVFDLTGANTALMTFRMLRKGSTARSGQGSWYLVDASEGQAAYAWHANDVAEAGVFEIQAGVPINGKLKHFAIREIQFIEPL